MTTHFIQNLKSQLKITCNLYKMITDTHFPVSLSKPVDQTNLNQTFLPNSKAFSRSTSIIIIIIIIIILYPPSSFGFKQKIPPTKSNDLAFVVSLRGLDPKTERSLRADVVPWQWVYKQSSVHSSGYVIPENAGCPIGRGFSFLYFFFVSKKNGPEIWTPTELVNFLLVFFQTALEPILSICFFKKNPRDPVYEILALLTFFRGF